MNKIKILFFATLRDRTGLRSLEIEMPVDTTVQKLKDKIVMDYPVLKELMGMVLVSVNKEYAGDESILPMNAEVAMFPPVSGG